jgi:putative ABC transport system ATP-binding protein
MTKSVLSVERVTKVYGKGSTAFTALSDVSLSITAGESVAIVGKSGSGKSTLMHILALLDKPTQGKLEVDGKPVEKLSGKQLDALRNDGFGFVFQQFFLNANATVLENVILPLKIAGVPAAERKERGLAVLRSVELEEKATNKANDLSGGQKQRLVIARALINKPRVIFADEPTGNLDTTTGGKIEDLLFKLNKEEGITLVVVTHDEDLAKRCTRQVSIKDGSIVKGA